MKAKVLMYAFALALPYLCGCATTNDVAMDHPVSWMADAQNDLLGKHALVTTNDGTAIEGRIIRLNADSLSVQDEFDAWIDTEPLANVATIRQPRRVYPVMLGFGGGAALGALVGMSIDASNNKLPTPGTPGFNSWSPTVDGVLWGSMIGAAGGGIVLGLATSVRDYRFIPASGDARSGGGR